jgi:hypothetical protein
MAGMARFVSNRSVHQLDALEHEAEAKPEDDADDNAARHELGKARRRAAQAQGQPNRSGDQSCAVDRGLSNDRCLRGLSYRGGAERFHRLHGKGRLVIQTADQQRSPKGK